MDLIKRMLKGGFILSCIITVIGVIAFHCLWISKTEGNSEVIASEYEPPEIGSEGETVADKMIVSDLEVPDYVGFSDIELVVGNGDRSRSIKLYFKGREAYAFLPSYTDLSKITIKIPDYVKELLMDGEDIENGQRLNEICIEYPYDLSIQVSKTSKSEKDTSQDDSGGGGADKERIRSFDMYQLRFMQSANLPTLFVDTESGSMKKLNEDKRNWERGEMACLTKDGSIDSEGGVRKIHGRGTSSWDSDQKSYSIRCAQPCDVLEMGEAIKWRIIGNAYDVTKERNALAFGLAKDLELSNALDYKYADVYFNGEYGGNYIICEGMEFSESQIDIDPNTDYLLQITNEWAVDDGDILFTTSNELIWRLMNENNGTSKEEVLELRKKIELIYQYAMNCSDEKVYAKLEKLIDVDSFVKMFIIDEMIDEADTNSNSMFYYYTMSDGKLHAGPVWDCDRSLGSHMGIQERFYFYNSFLEGPSEWMMKNESFRRRVQEVLSDNRFTIENFRNNVDRFYEKIASSVKMTRVLYGDNPDTWAAVWGIIDFGDMNENVRYLREYVDNRSRLIEAVIDSPDNYYEILINGKVYWLEKGDFISEKIVNQLCEDYSYEYLAYPSGVKFDPQRPIRSSLVLKGVYPEK